MITRCSRSYVICVCRHPVGLFWKCSATVQLSATSGVLVLENVHKDDLDLIATLIESPSYVKVKQAEAVLKQFTAARWLRLLDGLEYLDLLRALRADLVPLMEFAEASGQELLALVEKLDGEGAEQRGTWLVNWLFKVRWRVNLEALGQEDLLRVVRLLGIKDDDVGFFGKVDKPLRRLAYAHSSNSSSRISNNDRVLGRPACV